MSYIASFQKTGRTPRLSPKRENVIELVVILTAFIAVNVVCCVFQNLNSLNGGKGSDGVIYYAVAEQLSKGFVPKASAPSVYRIGTPLLAALLSDALGTDLILSFKIINIVGNLITVVLLALWLRRHLHNVIVRMIMVLLFVTQWHSPVRFVHFYPVYVDPLSFTFLLAGLLLIHSFVARPKLLTTCCLSALSFTGVMFKEIVFVIPLALLFSTNFLIGEGDLFLQSASLWFVRALKKFTPRLVLPLICGAAGLVTVRFIGLGTGDISFLREAFKHAYSTPILGYLTAWFITFGPVIVLAIYDWRRNLLFLRDQQHLLIYLASFAVLALAGYRDTERVLYWAMPVVYVLVGRSMQNLSGLLTVRLISVLAVAQLISQRAFLSIADPTLTPTFAPHALIPASLKSLLSYCNMWSCFCDPRVLYIYLFLYLSVALLTILWLSRNARRQLMPFGSSPKAA